MLALVGINLNSVGQINLPFIFSFNKFYPAIGISSASLKAGLSILALYHETLLLHLQRFFRSKIYLLFCFQYSGPKEQRYKSRSKHISYTNQAYFPCLNFHLSLKNLLNSFSSFITPGTCIHD